VTPPTTGIIEIKQGGDENITINHGCGGGNCGDGSNSSGGNGGDGGDGGDGGNGGGRESDDGSCLHLRFQSTWTYLTCLQYLLDQF